MTVAATPEWSPDLMRQWLRERERSRFRSRATQASLVVIACCWLAMGVGHAFGPAAWRSSGSYAVIKTLAPLRLWGLVFIVIGVLDLFAALSNLGITKIGIVVGAGVAFGWGTSFVAAGLVNKLTGAGWPLWFYFGFSQVMLSGYQVRRGR